MSVDIVKAINNNDIKNGTMSVGYAGTTFIKNNTYVSNSPTITEIENKYDDKFNDIQYYTT